MKCKKILNVALFGFCLGFVISSLNLYASAQTDEKPRLKNFGSSLKQKKDKNKHKSEITNKNISDDDDDVIKIDTNLVRTDVLVIDERGNAILGLKKADFIVTENNVQQEIGFFSLGDSIDIPRSIVLIIDYSESQKPYIKTSIEAAKVLIDKLNPRDRMAIVTDDVKVLTNFTSDKKLLKNKLDVIREKARSDDFGKSLQYVSLMATLNEMFDEEDIRPMVIFQTDGDQASILEMKDDPRGNKPVSISDISLYRTDFTVSDVINIVEKSRTTIYPVIVGFSLLALSPEERIRKTAENLGFERKSQLTGLINLTEEIFNQQLAMAMVAEASGGFASKLEKPEQADGIYSKILEESNSRYLIGYYPENLERDGKRRNVKIEVRGHPEYIVWGRKTYFAPGSEK